MWKLHFPVLEAQVLAAVARRREVSIELGRALLVAGASYKICLFSLLQGLS